MKGVSGQPPVNLTPVSGENKAQGSNKTEGSFGRFKITLPKLIQKFLSFTSQETPKPVSIQSRNASVHNPTSQLTVSGASNDNDSQSVQLSDKFNQALQSAKDNPQVKDKFSRVDSKLQALQLSKSNGSHNYDVLQARNAYKTAVKNFNDSVPPDLRIDAGDIEIAMANPNSLEADIIMDGKKYAAMQENLLPASSMLMV